jgi:hypothetical protein
MLHLSNIHTDDIYIIAHAINISTNEEADIAVEKNGDNFKISTGETVGDFVKACAELKYIYKHSKKLPKEKEINWGM